MVRTEFPSLSVSRRGSAGGDADCTVVWLSGEHDIATKANLIVTLARAAELDDVPLLVDLSAVTFMDASTIGAIVGSRNRLSTRAQSLEVRAPSPRALRLLELCRLTELVHREPRRPTSLAAALGTWVDASPAERSRSADQDAAPVAEQPEVRQPARVLAITNADIGQTATTTKLDHGGP